MASEGIDERFRVDSCLAKHASQCSHRQIAAMEWHNAGDAGFATLRAACRSSQHYMAAFLTYHLKAQTLHGGDDGGRRQSGQLRQR
jgi:hypothetical protein